MATIDLSKISYYNSATKSTSGTKSVSGYSSAAAAKNAAKTAATNAANSVGAGTPNSGGSSSTTDLKFGSSYGSVSGGAGTPGAAMDPDEGTYEGWCSYNSSRTSTMYQVKLKFTIPTGLTAANIASASISFTATANHTTSTEYYICAPKTTSEQTNYQKYGDTTIIDTSKYVSFTAPGNTNAKTYSLIITDIFKQCITNGQGWVTILLPRSTPESSRIMTLSGTPQITYTENYSACGAPTSVSAGASIQKPNGTVSISWSGANAGTNNAIVGYRIYWKSGGTPTTSSYTNYADVTSSPYPFTIPSGVTRGTTYYFKILTRGQIDGYNSGLSSAQATVKVNYLPEAPKIDSVSPTRIKSTGSTTVTFTVTAGSTNDTGQTASLYYATSASGTKTAFTSPLTLSLSAAATYYFWTYDGLEYSESSASQSIIKNVKPTISSVTMTAGATYSPNIIIQNTARSYVKSITGSTTATSSTGTVSKYYWKLQVWAKTTDAAAPSWSGGTNIGNPTTVNTLSSTDVTKYNATFNTAYRLAVIVEDDIGEQSTEAYSGTIFGIPPAPTVSVIYNQKGSSNKSGTNSSHFEDGIRINYNTPENTGVTRTLSYYDGSKWNSITRSAGTNLYDDLTLSGLSRGTNYTFKVVFSCGDASTTYTSSGYMRALNIKPTNISTTPTSGTVIKPYTQNSFNFSFCHQQDLVAWKPAQDVANYSESGANPSNIYTIKIKYNKQGSIPIVCSMNSNTKLEVPSGETKHYVSGSIVLSSITTTQWKDLLVLSDAPNTSCAISLEITATNSFGESFTESKTITVNFIEGIASIGTAQLQIKTGTSTYTKIPDNYNNKSSLERYHIFEGQVLRLSLSSLTCYANQSATVYFMDGSISLGTASITSSQWTAPSGTNRLYTLNTTKTIDYTVPANTGGVEKDFSVKVILDNGQSLTSTGSNLKSCYHMRFSPTSINFKITSANDSSQGWSCTDWGGSNSDTKYSDSYSSIQIQENYATSPNGTKTYIGSLTNIISIPSGGGGTGSFSNSLVGYNSDVLYLGAQVKVTLKFQPVVYPANFSATSPIPVGTKVFTYTYNNLFTYYRAVPNLLYGKNFFCLNMNQPTPGRTDQLLEIAATRDTTVSPNIDRDKIYFGTDGSNFQITTNGLVIDCGSW